MNHERHEEHEKQCQPGITSFSTEETSEQPNRFKDWRRTIGAFTDDVGMQDILRDAMRLREIDRKKARRRSEG